MQRQSSAGVIMRTIVILILFLSFSLPCSAETYHRGNRSCDFEVAEEYYKHDSEDLGNQTLYAICLIIKGEDAQGLAMLYPLADFQSRVYASFFLAEYLHTDGKFSTSISEENIDEALKYYFHNLALIALIPTYPEPDYWAHEKNNQLHLSSIYSVAELYLWKYQLGALGDYHTRSSYEEDHNRKKYPQYNRLMKDSLKKTLQQSQVCANLPEKYYFNPTRYKANIKVCTLLKDLVITLIPLEDKRQSILLQPHCNVLNESNCPEYYETHNKIHNLMVDYRASARKIFNPGEDGEQ